jgi:hypothetical protein
MFETNTINPNFLAPQSREEAIRRADVNYKNDLNAAAKAGQSAINQATAIKMACVKQARAELEQAKRRLSEARDHIEAGLRKRDLNRLRRAKKQMLTSSEDNFIKAIKQAKLLEKRLAAEAAKNRVQAIQKAYDTEKQIKLEAKQVSKRREGFAHAKFEEGHKAKRRAELVTTKADTMAQKADVTSYQAIEISLEKSIKVGERV